MDPSTINTAKYPDYDSPNNIIDIKDNEAYDEEIENDNSLPFGNKSKKLVRQEKSASTRTDYQTFGSIFVPCIVLCFVSKFY